MFAQSRTCWVRRSDCALCLVNSWYSRQVMSHSDSSFDRRQPPQQEKMMAAEVAAIGPEQPVHRSLHCIPRANAPELDRLAVRTASIEHSYCNPIFPGYFLARSVNP